MRTCAHRCLQGGAAGGQSNGTRLNTAYKDLVHRQDLVREVTALFDHFKHDRVDGETFGDFCLRIGVDALRERADTWLAQQNGNGEIGPDHTGTSHNGSTTSDGTGSEDTGRNEYANRIVTA